MAQDCPGFPGNADYGQKPERASTSSDARRTLALLRGQLHGRSIKKCAFRSSPEVIEGGFRHRSTCIILKRGDKSGDGLGPAGSS